MWPSLFAGERGFSGGQVYLWGRERPSSKLTIEYIPFNLIKDDRHRTSIHQLSKLPSEVLTSSCLSILWQVPG